MHNIFFINLRLCKRRILLLSTKHVVITPEGISVFLSFQPLPTLRLAAQNQEPQTAQLLTPAIIRPTDFPTSLLAFRKPSFWKSSSYPKQGQRANPCIVILFRIYLEVCHPICSFLQCLYALLLPINFSIILFQSF
jgi:hypothetical protein